MTIHDDLVWALSPQAGARATKIRVSPAVWQEMVAVWRATARMTAGQPKTFALVPIEEDEQLAGHMAVIERFGADPTIVVFT